jgi:hypothetical protein
VTAFFLLSGGVRVKANARSFTSLRFVQDDAIKTGQKLRAAQAGRIDSRLHCCRTQHGRDFPKWDGNGTDGLKRG